MILSAASSATTLETVPRVREDGLELLFASDRMGDHDIYVITRPDRASAWSAPTRLVALGSAASEHPGGFGADGLTLVMTSDRTGNDDLYVTTRPALGAAWTPPVALASLNTTASESAADLADGDRAIYFASDLPGVRDLVVATRTTTAAPFDAPAEIAELNSAGLDDDPWISPDGRLIVFASDRTGVQRLWQSTR